MAIPIAFYFDYLTFPRTCSPRFLFLLTTTTREWPTIPQIYVNGEFVGGCDILLGSESLSIVSYPALASVHQPREVSLGPVQLSVPRILLYANSNSSPVHQSGELEELLEKHSIIPPVEQSEKESIPQSS